MAHYQKKLSQQLQLLHELGYSDLDMPYQGAGVHSNKDSRELDTHRDVRMLDTIAVALTTGNPGDVFAATFHKHERVQLILAKNGPPTPDDISAANQLMRLVGSPAITDAMDLFPFLIRRCGTNINKRIYNLHTSLQDEQLLHDFRLELQEYTPELDIRTELPHMDDLLREDYGGAVPQFAILWGHLVKNLTDRTAHRLNADDVPTSSARFAGIYTYATALQHSRFLKTLVSSRNLLTSDRKARAEKLKRRLAKVCQYFSGITHLIEKAKRPRHPISHRWVTETFSGTGEGVFDLCDNAHDALSHELNQPSLSPEIIEKLDRHFPFILTNWATHQTVHACIHAEIRIILHLNPLSPLDPIVHPIGVSKRSCFSCMLWIEAHNRIFRTTWMTSGSHGKPYANWALPGSACSSAIGEGGMSLVDKHVLDGVSVRLTDTLAWLFPGQKRISDEHVSSSDDGSDDIQEPAQLLRRAIAHRRRV